MQETNDISIDYEREYFRLKEVEKENHGLKETIDASLTETIKNIEKELRKLSKEK